MNSGQSCVWDSSELPEHRYITQVYAKDTAPEEKVFVGELSSNLSGAPSDDDLKRVKDVFKGTGLAFYLIGKLKKSQVFLYMFQKRDKLYKYYSSVCSYQRFFRVPTTDQTESLARFVPGFLFDHMLILFL